MQLDLKITTTKISDLTVFLFHQKKTGGALSQLR